MSAQRDGAQARFEGDLVVVQALQRRYASTRRQGVVIGRPSPVRLAACLALVLGLGLASGRAFAAGPAVRFDIAAQPLGAALNQLAVQSNRQILFSPSLTAGRRSGGLHGVYSPEEALTRLLRDAELAYRVDGQSFFIQPAPAAVQPRGRLEIAAAGPATAAAAARPLEPSDIEGVVVTALKRPTLAQDTPISLTVVSGETLRQLGVVDLEQAAPLLSGLKLMSSAFGRRLTLRGVYGAGEATTGLYYDETPVTGPVGTTADPGVMTPELLFVDVDRLELLRGPQGTLYGAGAMGGALRVLFNKPDPSRFQASATGAFAASGQGGSATGAVGVVNAPIVRDRLAVRAVVYDYGEPGSIDNVSLGIKDVDASRIRGLRAGVLWNITDRASLNLSGATQSTRLDDISAWHVEAGPWRTLHDARAAFSGRIDMASGVFRWRSDRVSVTATSSYYRWDLTRRSDYSGILRGEMLRPTGCERYMNLTGVACTADQKAAYVAYVGTVYPALLNQPIALSSWINEVRANSEGGGRFDWTVGLYNEERRDRIDSQVVHADPATGRPVAATDFIGRRDINNFLSQSAVFGEASYHPAPGATLTLGARQFNYRKRDRGSVQVPNVISGTMADYDIDVSKEEEGWSLKALASQQLRRDVLVYVQASQGFRPGGANIVPGLPAALASYRADSLWNYEAGLKSQWLERRLTLNAAVYQIDWSDMQYSAQTANRAFSFQTNIGSTRIRGAEAELVARPAAGWEGGLSATVTDARLTADQLTEVAVGQGRKGDRLPVVPRYTASAYLQHQRYLTADLRGVARLDVAYAGPARSSFNAGVSDYLKIGDYAVFNASLGLRSRAWQADLSVDNLFNRAGRAQAQRNANGPIEVFGPNPRTLRLTLGRYF